MIEARGLRKSYGATEVLRGLALEARPGEVTLLIGPNGAGKSTTLKLLAGLATPDGGHAEIDGIDVFRHSDAARRRLSYLPQTADFHPHFTGSRLARFYADLRGAGRDRAAAALDLAGLTEHASRPVKVLSGGMKQRLGLALLLLPDAPVLLLDEPGLSLDPAWRSRLQEILRAEAVRGKTVLVTTHLLAEWNGVAHRCLLCEDGSVSREIDPAQLSADPVATAVESSRS
ncbi:MAG: ABC transporter ATP-binding protein [Verrucomicrobiales bacterium]